MGIRFNALLEAPADNSQVSYEFLGRNSIMRNILFCIGTCLATSLSAPLSAQVGTSQTDQAQQYLSNQAQTGQTPSSAASAEGASAIPSLQDVRSSLTTILNRPAAAQTGTGASAAGAPGARTTFPGTDLQQR